MTDHLKRFRSYRYLRPHSKVDRATRETTPFDRELKQTRIRFLRSHAREFLSPR